VKDATLEDMAKRSCRLIVQGKLSDTLEPAFPGMTLTRADGNTALTGDVRDQAGLQGLLQRGPASGFRCWKLTRSPTFPVAALKLDPAHPRGAMTHQ
jgi:hypothetical protein